MDSGAFSAADLPGIGRRYEVRGRGGDRLCVVQLRSGDTELVITPAAGTGAAMTLPVEAARTLQALIAGGDVVTPAAVEDAEDAFSALVIDSVRLPADAPVAGLTLAELDLRRVDGATVLAIVRAKVPLAPPPPDEVLQAGDRLLLVASADDFPSVVSALVGSGEA